MKETGMLACFFAPLIPFPARKFSEQMETKGTRKFRVSAPQPIVYGACNCEHHALIIYRRFGAYQEVTVTKVFLFFFKIKRVETEVKQIKLF